MPQGYFDLGKYHEKQAKSLVMKKCGRNTKKHAQLLYFYLMIVHPASFLIRFRIQVNWDHV